MQRCKGTARCLEKHSTQVTLCCAHGMCCKHRDKPWFSWRPAAAEHGQNEQKNKRMVKTGRQSMSQQKRMVNTNQPHSQNEIQPSVCPAVCSLASRRPVYQILWAWTKFSERDYSWKWTLSLVCDLIFDIRRKINR